jgi:UDP-N-acetylmuramate--alanine ligase
MIATDALDLSHPRRLHLVGVGGSGMGPFARLLRADGHRVSGADARGSPALESLREADIEVRVGADYDRLPEGVEAVIRSAAIPEGAPPLRAAAEAGLPVVKYARALGLFSASKETYAVAGTHGKSTTTSLLAWTMRRCGLDPSFIVGASAPQLGGGSGRGSSGRFVVEACEYDRSFLHFSPECAVVTNVEADHLDYYRDLFEIQGAFRAFAERVRGVLVLHEGLVEPIAAGAGVRARILSFGPSPRADLRFEITARRGGLTEFHAAGRRFHILLPGGHNVANAAAVVAVAEAHGWDLRDVADALANFRGVGRRLEVLGRPRGVPVVDDYAHHPTEIEAGIRALREEFAPRRIWCVFQPHQHSRTSRLLDEFARVLATADRVVIPEIYAARDSEAERRAVTGADLVRAVRACGGDAVHMSDFRSIVDFLRTQVRAGDVVVTMGAGDVGDVAGRLAEAL